MTPDQEDQRGNEADRLLNDSLFKEAFAETEKAIVQAMKTAPVGDKDFQHELVLTLQLLNRVHGYIKTVADTGKMARIQKRTLADRMLRR